MKKILFSFYNIILLVFSPFFFIILLFLGLIKNNKSAGFFYKFFPFAYKPLRSAGNRAVWIHAVSLGELRASVNFIGLIKERTGKNIYLSVTTRTGYDSAKELYKNNKYVSVFYFPYDFNFSVKSVLKLLEPVLFISVETEIWPNLFNMLKERNIPVAVINARISDSSYKNYLNFAFFFKHVFGKIDLVLCISGAYCEKFSALGVKRENMHATGNMKFDLDISSVAKDLEEKSRNLKNIFKAGKIIAAGSTHKGEERLIIDAAAKLNESERNEKIFLFIAPRHPERFAEVEGLLKDMGAEYYKLSYIYSQGCGADILKSGAQTPAVILVDIIGELLAVYNICCVAFVGGSMVSAGGHNLLEPLFFGKPVIFGSYIENFREIADEIIKNRAGRKVRTPMELRDALYEYLYDEKSSDAASKNGLSLIARNKGSSILNLDYLSGLIESFNVNS